MRQSLRNSRPPRSAPAFRPAPTIRCLGSRGDEICCAALAAPYWARRRSLRRTMNPDPAACSIIWQVLRRRGELPPPLSWPGRTVLGGVPLGDCWRHPAIKTGDATDQLMPLHKLSQWLTYSLVEPMERAGIVVTEIDGLTGLAEYRNGGLFIDTGALALRDQAYGERRHEVGSTLVVEWRALTVALLDRLAALVRQRLGRDANQLPLTKILQGGTWAAGRAIARRLRPDGSPPLQVISDGTVF